MPVRFILACADGHLDDFPWEKWAEHAADCKNKSTLKLVSLSAGLAGLVVQCKECGKVRSVEAAFDREVMQHFRCAGLRPWLASPPQACNEHPRVVQRGASNLYFPVVESSLLIPPWDSEIEARLGDYWADVLDADPADRFAHVRRLLDRGRVDIPPDWDPDEFARIAVDRAVKRESLDTTNLRSEEWQQFAFANIGGAPASRDFEVHRETVPPDLSPEISHVVRAVRLRELRALRGFTRIDPPPAGTDESESTRIAALATGDYSWLPAVEVRGEGVFVAIDDARVTAWETLPAVNLRLARLNAARRAEHYQRFEDDVPPPADLTARHLLAHALAHALMRQLALECGYSTAALRERIYAGEGQCGLLIYTATTDADGTLGGLQRQGEAARIAGTLRDAIEAQRWCSSDPLCIRGVMMASNASNLAACHACLLAPETSCEHFNQYLDRALLVGTPEEPEIGFFAEWLA